MTPTISGLHHATFVVSDLDAGIEWFSQILGARHIPRFDHHDEAGARFGVIVELDGFPGMLEIRVATDSYPVPVGYDPLTFEVADDAALDAWLAHLDSVGARHSPVKQRRTGRSIEITSPDGVLIRLFTAPVGGVDEVPFQEQNVDH
jgi:catechol 2,3-dioxygenase-like lactoylglutathione lyase family enzyme